MSNICMAKIFSNIELVDFSYLVIYYCHYHAWYGVSFSECIKILKWFCIVTCPSQTLPRVLIFHLHLHLHPHISHPNHTSHPPAVSGSQHLNLWWPYICENVMLRIKPMYTHWWLKKSSLSCTLFYITIYLYNMVQGTSYSIHGRYQTPAEETTINMPSNFRYCKICNQLEHVDRESLCLAFPLGFSKCKIKCIVSFEHLKEMHLESVVAGFDTMKNLMAI